MPAAAAVTTRLQVATGICLVVQRDPIQTAKEVATLDQVSGGRFLFGIGAGWNAEEMADHGTEFKSRFAVMRERVEAMKAIWTKSKAEYSGEHVKWKGTRCLKGRVIEAESDEEVLLDCDGEQPGRLPCRMTVLPGAVRLKV